MSEFDEIKKLDFLELTGDIVSAYVSKNSIAYSRLGELIVDVHQALQNLGKPREVAADQIAKPTPAQIKKSITPNGLISFLDGRLYQTLKRHLTQHGLDLNTYIEQFGLPRDYPSVAPHYAARRSELAKSIGLGQIRSQARAREKEASEGKLTEPPKRRGRPPKAV